MFQFYSYINTNKCIFSVVSDPAGCDGVQRHEEIHLCSRDSRFRAHLRCCNFN